MAIDKKFLATFLGIDVADIQSVNGLDFTTSHSTEAQSFPDLLLERFKQKFAAVLRAVTREDNLGAILKGHIHIEHELEEFITFAAPAPSYLKLSGMEFSEKVQLSLVLGLTPDLKPALTALGTLRNQFAHRLDVRLGAEQLKNLRAALPPSARQKFQEHVRTMSIADANGLAGEARSMFKIRIELCAFVAVLFDGVSSERHRAALDRIGQTAVH